MHQQNTLRYVTILIHVHKKNILCDIYAINISYHQDMVADLEYQNLRRNNVNDET